ncbi:MAG: Hpt domain-containing protein [Candidatus Rokubacteria bacterium]|nr:Hpt domain-containing protein [Candidatus Rokubacteria bacterium]
MTKPMGPEEMRTWLMPIFRAEAREQAAAIASGIDVLDGEAGRPGAPLSAAGREALDSAFRACHSLASSAATVGLAELHDIGRAAEEALGRVRDGGLALDAPLLGALHEAAEALGRLAEGGAAPAAAAAIVGRLRRAAGLE